MNQRLNVYFLDMKKIIAAWILILSATGVFCADKNKLPATEKTIMNSADHWRLGFYDQVRRFETAEQKFKAALGTQAPENFMVGIQNSLVKVPVNKYWFKGIYTNKVKLSAAKNEYESFQIAAIPYIGKELKEVTLKVSPLKQSDGKGVIEKANMKIYCVGRIKIINSRCPADMSDQLWPDPLLPNKVQKAEKMDLALFWVEIKIPKGALPGNYTGELQLTADGETIPVGLKLHVYNFTLPDRVPFPVTVWTKNPVKGDMQVYRQVFAEFLQHGIDPLNAGKDTWKLDSNDFGNFDEIVSFCLKRGQQVFEIARVNDKNKEKIRPLYEHLKEKKWIDKAIIYTNKDEADENTYETKNIPFYREMKKLYPGLRIFAASEYHKNIDKGCDIWLNDLSTGTGMKFASENKGKAVLWNYYCGLPINCDFFAPLEDAPQMMVEHPGIEHRLPFWIAWKYEIKPKLRVF
ncbi:MAG: DUF6067 family protein [Victivallales bacterium]|nr:DUF6067 family protein [Victivallales bacterium]